MTAATARAGEPLADDPRNQVLDMLESMLDAAIRFAKDQDCEAQLRTRIRRMLPDLAPAADLFGKPLEESPLSVALRELIAADKDLTDLECSMAEKAPSALGTLRLTSRQHNANANIANVARKILAVRKHSRGA